MSLPITGRWSPPTSSPPSSISGARSWGPRLEYILTNALRLLLDAPGSTLLGLPRLLADETYRSAPARAHARSGGARLLAGRVRALQRALRHRGDCADPEQGRHAAVAAGNPQHARSGQEHHRHPRHHGSRPGADRQSGQGQARRGADAFARRVSRHRLRPGRRGARRRAGERARATSPSTPTSSSISPPTASPRSCRKRASIAWRWCWRISSSAS